jgi:hypothetical protein
MNITLSPHNPYPPTHPHQDEKHSVVAVASARQ